MNKSGNKANLEDTKIDVKVKLSISWIVLMFLYLYNDVLTFYRKDTIDGVMAGEFGAGAIQVTPEFLFAGAILMSIPIFMIFLSVILPAKINRWTNIIVGIFHIVLLAATALVPGDLWSYYALYMALEGLFIILIIWHAWKWPHEVKK